MREAWQIQLSEAVHSMADPRLTGYAFLSSNGLTETEKRFRVLIPPYYLGLINPKDAQDPIARMAFPDAQEMAPPAAGLRDPIGDLSKKAAARLTHRYPQRALLHVTNLCPMYCRFCFRKNLMNEKEGDLYSGDFEEAFAYLRAHPEIDELILTGGDPWMLSDEKINALVNRIAEELPSIRRLRFHSRMPVTLPMRISESLVKAITRPGRFRTFVVTHFNHPNELTEPALAALSALQMGGITVLNQSVLLRGVNDSVKTLQELFVGLGNLGVLPYYLHHCDLVEGAEHFRLPLSEGRRLVTELRGKIPGYLLPEYILDLPGGLGKIPVGENFLSETSDGQYAGRGVSGEAVFYRDPETTV